MQYGTVPCIHVRVHVPSSLDRVRLRNRVLASAVRSPDQISSDSRFHDERTDRVRHCSMSRHIKKRAPFFEVACVSFGLRTDDLTCVFAIHVAILIELTHLSFAKI